VTSIVIVSAGLSVPSSTRLLADRIAAATSAALEDPEGTEVVHVELRDLAHDLTDNLLTGFPSPRLAQALDAVRRSDGLVAVTPVFSASYSGLFKTFFDVLEPGSLDGKPVLVAATAGTARHSLVLDHALRPLFTYLHAVVVPTGVFAATDDFGDAGLDARIARAAGELASLAGRPRVAGSVTNLRRSVEDAIADPTPFEQLLRTAGAGRS
jgi:FMN reductase